MTFTPAPLRLPLAALLLACALALAGCQTDSTAKPVARAAPVAPIDHRQAALDCWMDTEHGHADLPLDKRTDVVDACIKAKMAGEPWPPAHAGKPNKNPKTKAGGKKQLKAGPKKPKPKMTKPKKTKPNKNKSKTAAPPKS